MSHTPGPWRYRSGDEEFPPAVIRDIEGGFLVKGLSSVRQEADARLIAAAPDLLAALEEILSRFDDDNLKLTVDAIQESRAAIKKAKGEQ